MEQSSQVAMTAGLYADPTRAGIILALAGSGHRTVSDLAAVAWNRVSLLHTYRLAGARVTDALKALIEAGGSIGSRQPLDARVAQFRPDQSGPYVLRPPGGPSQGRRDGRLVPGTPHGSWSHRATKAGGYCVTKRGSEFFRGLDVNLSALRIPTLSIRPPLPRPSVTFWPRAARP